MYQSWKGLILVSQEIPTGKPRATEALELVEEIAARGVVSAWVGETLVDFRLTVQTYKSMGKMRVPVKYRCMHMLICP